MKARRRDKSIMPHLALVVALATFGCKRETTDESISSTWRDLEAAAAADPNLFASGMSGVAASKPSTWRFVPNERILQMRDTVTLEGGELEDYMRKVQLPVVSIMKYSDTHQGGNPTVQIGVRSKKYYPSNNPVELLRSIIKPMLASNAMPRIEIIEQVKPAKIDDIPAATVTVRHTLHFNSGESSPAMSKMYYAINSKNVIIIGVSAPSTDWDQTQADFSSIVESLRLAR